MKKLNTLILGLILSMALGAQSVAYVTPNSSALGDSSVNLVLTGNNTYWSHTTSYTVTFTSGSYSITGFNTSAVNNTTINTTIDIAPGSVVGNYNVVVSGGTSGQATLTDGFTINTGTMGITGITDYNIEVYPNPARGSVYIAPDGGAGIAAMSLTALSGQVVLRQAATGSGQQQINITGIASGIYILSVTDRTGAVAYRKVAVE